MPQRIDAFTHVLTEEFYETLVADHEFKGLSGDPSFFWDFENRIDDMDEFGIDKQVLTIALPPIWQGMDDDDALELTKLANDEIRRVAEEFPDRFIPVGTVPKVSGEFMDEFDRCIDDLGMAGIQIFSNVDGQPIDRPAFHPLYERADRNDVPLWIHPQLHEWYDWASEYMEHRLFGWPFDTTLALSRLVFSGVMDEYDLDVLAHHMGGMVPFYGGRIDSFYESRMEFPENYQDTDLPDLDRPVSDYFRDFYADTAVSGSLPAHELGYSFFGDDRLVFGTDYPFGPRRGRKWVEAGLRNVDDMRVSDETRRRILADNLLELVD